MLLRREFRETPPDEIHREPLGDLRFRSLLAKEDWAALPHPIRRRFSKRVAAGEAAIYKGEVVETRMTRMGWLFAQLGRLFGAPLPLSASARTPAIVTVTEDAAGGGQNWTRIYARARGLPQVIQSAKCFAGVTGLEEHVGGRIGMALTVRQANGALVFRSAFYFLRLGPQRVTLPSWLTPGALTVTHAEESGGRFSFRLEIAHPLFGTVLRQFAIFREVTP